MNTNYYEMFDDEGDLKVDALVQSVIQGFKTKSRTTWLRELADGMKKLASEGHEEVYDTAAREAIAQTLNKALRRSRINEIGRNVTIAEIG